MTGFGAILERAQHRKGGPAALQALLPPVPGNAALASVTDKQVLAEMAKRVFCAGFAWSVIEAKWPGFEAAFLGFDPAALVFQPDEFWDALTRDTRIVRNGAKIMSVRGNAALVQAVAGEHGSFGRFLANWPAGDQAGLLDLLNKRGKHLGGNTAQMLLRFLGWDGYVLSGDVVACLRDAGLDIAAPPKSKGDLAKAQVQFNAWAAETGLPYTHLSKICAMSIGSNLRAEEMHGLDGA